MQVSSNARFVLFASDATNLVKGDTNDFEDVFLRDRHTHTTQIVPHVTVDVDGTWVMSGNARYFAFASPGHDNQIGWFDRATGAVKHSTVGNDEVGVYGVSDDGSTVLVNGSFGPRIWKPLTGLFTRIDQGVDGQWANAWINPDALAADGRYVMFTTPANNIVRGDTNHASDVFVRDLKTGRAERVSVGPHNAQSNRNSSGEALSADGRYRLLNPAPQTSSPATPTPRPTSSSMTKRPEPPSGAMSPPTTPKQTGQLALGPSRPVASTSHLFPRRPT